MVPYSKTRQLLCIQPPKPDLPPEERIVRGTIVKGLNDKDVKLLDYFEGAVREPVLSSCTPQT